MEAGGESVSQLALEDKVFSTFLDQNPPFEQRPEMGFRFRGDSFSVPPSYRGSQSPWPDQLVRIVKRQDNVGFSSAQISQVHIADKI
jgi:hypothetical protein